MQAVVVEKYDSIHNIRLKQVPLPEVSAGHVRVRIQAASVGFVDGLKVQGLYQTKDALPFTPGSEFAGVVDEAAASYVARLAEPASWLPPKWVSDLAAAARLRDERAGRVTDAISTAKRPAPSPATSAPRC